MSTNGPHLSAVEEVAEGVWAVPMSLPGAFPGGSMSISWAYVIDDFSGGFHVLDPGWDLPENIARWEEFLADHGKTWGEVATVTASHLHRDHLGLAGEFQRRSGAALVMHEQEARTVSAAARAQRQGKELEANRLTRTYTLMTRERLAEFGVPDDRREELQTIPPLMAFPQPHTQIVDGEELPIPGRSIVALRSPGHTGGHICLVEKSTGIIFTGDHVLPGINSGIGLGGESPTNPVADYLRSLERIAEFDSYTAAPGHGRRFPGLAQRAQTLAAHHGRRSREVAAAMPTSDTVWEIAARIRWSDGFETLRGYKLASALSQVAMHMEYVRAGGDG